MAVEFAAGLQSYSTPAERFDLALGLLGIEESTLVQEIYRGLRSSPDPELRYIGVTGLLRGTEATAALGEIADNIELIRTLSASFFVTTAICGALNTDPIAVRSLGKIASSSDQGFDAAPRLH